MDSGVEKVMHRSNKQELHEFDFVGWDLNAVPIVERLISIQIHMSFNLSELGHIYNFNYVERA